GETRVRSGHVLLAMFKTNARQQRLTGISKQFAQIKEGVLADEFDRIVGSSPEAAQAASDGSSAVPGQSSDAIAPAAMGKQEALKKFAVDLTEKARKGELDPVSGRDD